MIKAILFDLDQTLIDSKKAHYMALKASLEREGYPDVRIKWTYGLTSEEIIAQSAPELNEETIGLIAKEKKKLLRDYLSLIKVLPYTYEILDFIKGLKLKIGLITSNSKSEIEEILDLLKMKQYFDIIISKEDSEPKPSPHPLIKALKLLKLSNDEIIYVGDSDVDIEAANAARIKVAISQEVHATQNFIERATWVLKDLRDLKEIIQNLLNEKR